MQDQDTAEKATTSAYEYGTPPLSTYPARIPLPRCQCCGALIPLIKSAECINDPISCMVCGHRNR